MNAKTIILGLAILTLIAYAVNPVSAGTISGYVTEPQHNEPVQYVCVWANDSWDKTDANGAYTIPDVTGGPHTVIACIASLYCNTTIASEGATNVNITLALERAKTSENITMLDEEPFEMLMDSWGAKFDWDNETSCDDMATHNNTYNFTLFSMAIAEPHINIMGNLFFFFLFSMPFLMMYLRQENVLIPSIIGLILGGTILNFLPAEFHLGAVSFIALSITGVLYILLKERS
jgi:hypothetical protein